MTDEACFAKARRRVSAGMDGAGAGVCGSSCMSGVVGAISLDSHHPILYESCRAKPSV